MAREVLLDTGFVVVHSGLFHKEYSKYIAKTGVRIKSSCSAWFFLTSATGASNLSDSPRSAHVFKTSEEAWKRIKKIRGKDMHVIDLSTAKRKTLYCLGYDGSVDELDVPEGVCRWSEHIFNSALGALTFAAVVAKLAVTRAESELVRAKEKADRLEAIVAERTAATNNQAGG